MDRTQFTGGGPNAPPTSPDPSTDPFYVDIDRVIAALRADNRTTEAARIHALVHEMAWTTSSEFAGELRRCFNAILHAKPGVPAPIAADLERLIHATDVAIGARW